MTVEVAVQVLEPVSCFEFDIDPSIVLSSDLQHYLVLLLVERLLLFLWESKLRRRPQQWQHLVGLWGRQLHHRILLTTNRCPSANFPYST